MSTKRKRRALKHRLIRKWPKFAERHKYGEYSPLNYVDRAWESHYLSHSPSITGIREGI